MKTPIAIGGIIAAALACASCEFRTASDIEAELEAHYGTIAAIDPDLMGVNRAAAEVEEFQFIAIEPGSWRSTTTVSGSKSRDTRQRCHRYPRRIDQALDLTPIWSMTKDCRIKTSWTSGTYAIDYACDDGRQKMNARATVTGDFAKRYIVETKISMSPARRGVSTMSMTTTAERTGDC